MLGYGSKPGNRSQMLRKAQASSKTARLKVECRLLPECEFDRVTNGDNTIVLNVIIISLYSGYC